MPIYTQQPNMAFATLQEDFTDDGADDPTFDPTYISLTEDKTALFSNAGFILVADDRTKIPDDTDWAVYKYEAKADQSGDGTDDSLTTLSRAEAKNRNFSTSHTFTAGEADVIVADSVDQLNTILATIEQIHYNDTEDEIEVLKDENHKGHKIAELLSISQVVNTKGDISGATTIDLSNGAYVEANLTGDVTLSFSGSPDSGVKSFVLRFTTADTSYTITWPDGTKFAGGTAPVILGSEYELTCGIDSSGNLTVYGVVDGIE